MTSSQDEAEQRQEEPQQQEPHQPQSPPATLSHLPLQTPPNSPTALKILFLSSDTGGGHRASATSLAQQFARLYPGSIHALCDIVQLDGPPPYNSLVRTYQHLSSHPAQWKLVYNVSNTRAYEMLADVHMKGAMERSVRKRIQSYSPDVVVSVHPLMTNVPVLACSNISKETGRHLPIFTVVTDLGSAHSMWFANGVEKLFVASEAIRNLARERGKVPEEKIVMSGLPIRHDFSTRSQKMGVRHSDSGRQYQQLIRQELGYDSLKHHKMVLVMGGGEGCGRLSAIVDSLYLQFVEQNIRAVILVVCGRNVALKESLAKRDWNEMRHTYTLARQKGADFESCVGLLTDSCGGAGVAHHLRRIISSPSMLGLGRVENPFSPVNIRDRIDGERDLRRRESNSSGGDGGVGNELKNNATSAPGSRSASPVIESVESVEVVTKSCAEREDLYNLSTLIGDDDGGKRKEEYRVTSETVTPETQIMTSSSHSSDEDIEILEESVSHEEQEPDVKVIGLGFITQMAGKWKSHDMFQRNFALLLDGCLK